MAVKVWYDFEFLEDGASRTVHPLSVGMVREDGEELYAVFRDAPWAQVWEHDWLRSNVAPHLGLRPSGHGDMDLCPPEGMDVVKGTGAIRNLIADFLLDPKDILAKAELWGYYADYDHVCLAQTFGRMVDLPKHVPMLTYDLKQAQHMLAADFKFGPHDVERFGPEHHALADARWQRWQHNDLADHMWGKVSV